MMVIPDYLIYDELREREQQQIDGGLQPLHLPLYRPEPEESRGEDAPTEPDQNRGVVIIDMDSWDIVAD